MGEYGKLYTLVKRRTGRDCTRITGLFLVLRERALILPRNGENEEVEMKYHL